MFSTAMNIFSLVVNFRTNLIMEAMSGHVSTYGWITMLHA